MMTETPKSISDLIDNTFYELELLSSDDFNKLRETLTRIGLPSRKDGEKTLTQTAHVLHKQGRYYLVHFKQMFLLDGKTTRTEFTLEDKNRLAKIISLLSEWGLIKVAFVPEFILDEDEIRDTHITIVPYKNKNQWKLVSKYDVGTKHRFF